LKTLENEEHYSYERLKYRNDFVICKNKRLKEKIDSCEDNRKYCYYQRTLGGILDCNIIAEAYAGYGDNREDN